MPQQVSIARNYLPVQIADKVMVTQAHVGKIGYVDIEFKEELKTKCLLALDSDQEPPIDEFLSEFYSTLTKSSYVLEVSPKLEQLLSKQDDYSLGPATFAVNTKDANMPQIVQVRLAGPVHLHIVVPEPKRGEIFRSFPWEYAPEQFAIYYNGGLFLALAPTHTVPIATDIGQVARELLFDTMNRSEGIGTGQTVGPSPMHPEIYFLEVKGIRDSPVDDISLPTVSFVDGDLVIVFADHLSIETAVDYFLRDSRTVLGLFYEAAKTRGDMFERHYELYQLNKMLGELLVSYFQKNSLQRFFGKTPTAIRCMLSRMHLCMQNISDLELVLRTQSQQTIQYLERSSFLPSLKPYLVEKLRCEEIIDKNAPLTIMSFAAEETTNFTIIQTTLLSAFLGAIIGGLITIVAQALLE